MVFSTLPCFIHGSKHFSHTRVAFWCKEPVTSMTKFTFRSMAANISSRFNISLAIDVLNMNFSADKVYDVLDEVKEYNKESGMFVITNLGLKKSWLWARMLGNTESIVVDVLHQDESYESQVCCYLKIKNLRM